MKENKFQVLVLFSLSFLLYFNTLQHNYVLDDFSVIKNNVVVKKGYNGIPTIWKTHYRYGYGFQQASLYRPLTLSLFALQWEIAPDSPSFAHWFNVIGYSLLGIILYFFLLQLLGKEKRLIAFLATALFIAHPIHTEVVANIKSIDDILASCFSLLALTLLLKNIDENHKRSYWISLGLFTLAFLSKESTVTFLAIIPVTLILFRSFSFIDSLKKTAAYFIPFAIYLALRIQALGSINGDKKIARLDNLLLTAPDEFSRVATAIKIMGLYLWKLVFPHPLMNDYSLKQIEIVGFDNLYTILSILIYTGIIIVLIKLWKSNPIIAFGILFFLLSISLYSNIVLTIGTSFGERLLFMPSLGFCIVVAYLIQKPFEKKVIDAKFFKSAFAPLLITGLLIGLYSFKTIDRNKAWKDNFTLYSTDVINCDKSARCHYYHGLGLMKEKASITKDPIEKQKLLTQAVDAFNKSIQILPTYSDAWGQKGLAYFRLRNYEEAEKSYLKATEFNPSNATAFSNLGSLYFNNQRYKEAKNSYEKAIRINPNHLDAIANYASTLGTLGDYQGAIRFFKKAITLNPNEPNYYQMVGMTYQNLGKATEANEYFLKAKRLGKQ